MDYKLGEMNAANIKLERLIKYVNKDLSLWEAEQIRKAVANDIILQTIIEGIKADIDNDEAVPLEAFIEESMEGFAEKVRVKRQQKTVFPIAEAASNDESIIVSENKGYQKFIELALKPALWLAAAIFAGCLMAGS